MAKKRPPQVRPVCVFCKTRMGKKPYTQSKEHVLRESMLKKLGFYDTVIESVAYLDRNRDVRALKPQKAGRFMQTNICEDCNNGWMNRVDEAAEQSILDIYEKRRRVEALTHDECNKLALWTLKTACVAFLTKDISVKSMPWRHYKHAIQGSWPDGAVAWVSYLRPEEHVGAWINGMTRNFSPGETINSRFYTFIAQYGDLAFGLTFVEPLDCWSVLQEGIHFPYCQSASPFYLCRDLTPHRIPGDTFPIDHSTLNTVLRLPGLFVGEPMGRADDKTVFYMDPRLSPDDNKIWYGHFIELLAIAKYPGKEEYEKLLDRVDGFASEIEFAHPSYLQDRPTGFVKGDTHLYVSQTTH